MVPLVVSVLALVWIFRVIDGLTAPLFRTVFAPNVPPPGLGILTTAAVILIVGVVATNMFGKRLLQRLEGYLLRVPVFRTIYAPIKQLVLAFSPDNEYGFKRVVMVRTAARGIVLGFLTKEFSVESAGKVESLVAVFVPTNHLYLGDIVICPAHTRDLREAVVHGMLHLLGMDHEADSGEMLRLQGRLLRQVHR